MKEIKTGTNYTCGMTVTESHSAENVGSGDLSVLATPAMIAMMENAALNAIAPLLEPGESSVGTAIAVEHVRASLPGTEVNAMATVTAVEGRRVDFELVAADEQGNLIGKGTHSRFVVDVEKFMGKIKK